MGVYRTEIALYFRMARVGVWTGIAHHTPVRDMGSSADGIGPAAVSSRRGILKEIRSDMRKSSDSRGAKDRKD